MFFCNINVTVKANAKKHWWCIWPGSWAVGAWSNAEKGVMVHSGSEGAANTVSVGAGTPLTRGSEAGIFAGGGECTEMTL